MPSIDQLLAWIEVQRLKNYGSLHYNYFSLLAFSHCLQADITQCPNLDYTCLFLLRLSRHILPLALPHNCLCRAIFVYFSSSSCEQPKQESSTEVPVLLAAPISKYLRQACKVATRTFPTSRMRSWVKRKVPVVPVQFESWAMSFQRTSSVSSAAPAHSINQLTLNEINHAPNHSTKLKTDHHILPVNLSIGLH